ncbi:hypothetical protein [Acuticoccus sediminis]|uniref:hypothetical protein n=1 Tax=Acuticoccus sediminis TaxID=2184697 RepID=UPI001CFD7047|nr:hypothetical protein [Acuticoccus sediminis]
MAQRHVVVVPPPDLDGSRSIKDLLELLRQQGCETTVSSLDHVAGAPPGAHAVFVFRSLEAVLVEAMTRGVQPSSPVNAWIKSATAILDAHAAHAPSALLVDFADLEFSAPAVVEHVLAETDLPRRRGRRAAKGDPVLRALARTATAETPKARKLIRDLNAAALLTAPDGTHADTAFLYYSGILKNRDQAAQELAAASLAEISGERNRLRAEVARLRTALAAKPATLLGATVGFGPTFAHPAFYALETSAKGRAFRWMGRESEAVIPVTITPGNAVKVAVTIELVIDGDALDGLEIGLGGQIATRYETRMQPNGQIVKSAEFTGLPPDSETLDVVLRQRHVLDCTPHGDTRTLGCGLVGLSVVPVPPEPPAEKVAPPPDADDDEPVPPVPEAVAVAPRAPMGVAPKPVVPRPATRTVGAPGAPLSVVILVDEGFDEAAFYPLEHRPDGLPFAWMGVRDEQAFTVTIPLDRPVRVEAHLAVVIDDEALSGLEIEFDQEEPQSVETSGEGGCIVKSAVFAPIDPTRALSEPVQVVLKATHAVDLTDKGDGRTLSVGLHKLVVRQL